MEIVLGLFGNIPSAMGNCVSAKAINEDAVVKIEEESDEVIRKKLFKKIDSLDKSASVSKEGHPCIVQVSKILTHLTALSFYNSYDLLSQLCSPFLICIF